MNFEVISEPVVETDLNDIVKYYDSINPKLTDRFLLQFANTEIRISNLPFGFQIKYKNVRTIQLRKFPFIVHYFLNEPQKQAVIIAVTHSRKKPTDYTLR